MTALQTPAAAARPAAAATARVFWAVLRRDLYVTGRELPVFLAQVVLQPLGGRAALGLILGTAVPVNRINVLFALILTPLLFTGPASTPGRRWTSSAGSRS